MRDEKLVSRFIRKVSQPAHGGACWQWVGSLNRNGYGQIRISGRTIKAHRASWVIHFGEIPGALHVLHRCDNRCCVNPDHLFLGTNDDNIADRMSKGRSRALRGPEHPFAKRPELRPRGERHGRSTITEGVAVKILSATGTRKQIADAFGVTVVVVNNIKRRKTWKHIHMEIRE